MKKIIIVLVIGSALVVSVFGYLHVVSELKMNRMINEVVDNMDTSYYKGLASTCFKKSRSEYQCCLASVEVMSDIGAKVAQNEGCGDMQMDQLRCSGSFRWCILSFDEGNSKKECLSDADCVPATCCHANEVVYKDIAPDCNGIMCTMSCETILDCGRGKPVCNDGLCDIKIMNGRELNSK